MLLKLLNSRNNRKENLPDKPSLSIYTSLLPELRPLSQDAPEFTAFLTLNNLRLYITLDWLLRLIKQQNPSAKFEFVATPENADLSVSNTINPAIISLKIGELTPPASQNDATILAKLSDWASVRYYLAGYVHSQALEWQPTALENAQVAVDRLSNYATSLENQAAGMSNQEKSVSSEVAHSRVLMPLNDNLDTTHTLANLWGSLQAKLPAIERYTGLTQLDHLLGLEVILDNRQTRYYWQHLNQPESKSDHFATSNAPKSLKPISQVDTRPNKGTNDKAKTKAKPPKLGKILTGYEGQAEKTGQPDQLTPRKKLQSSREINSHLREADRFEFSISLIASNNLPELRATVDSLLPHFVQQRDKAELIIVDMNSESAIVGYLETLRATHRNMRVVWAAQNLGEAAGRNIALKQAYGKYLLLLDAGTIAKGDILQALQAAIDPNQPALYGLNPVKLVKAGDNYSYFEPLSEARTELQHGEGLDGSLLCFPRKAIEQVGLLDEHFRYHYALGLDYSYNFFDKNLPVIALPILKPLVNLPDPRPNYSLTPDLITRQQAKNWGLFLKSWDLLNIESD